MCEGVFCVHTCVLGVLAVDQEVSFALAGEHQWLQVRARVHVWGGGGGG